MAEQFSRREVVLKGGLTLAGLTAAVTGGALALQGAHGQGATVTGATYRLQATDECQCAACQAHAANKLFATRAAAEHCRAHAGCRCVVVRSAGLDDERWRALFGPASELHRTSVDRRWTATRRILKGGGGRAAPAPAALDQGRA